MNLFAIEPEGYKAMVGLENYVNSTGLTPIHKELIKYELHRLTAVLSALTCTPKMHVNMGRPNSASTP